MSDKPYVFLRDYECGSTAFGVRAEKEYGKDHYLLSDGDVRDTEAMEDFSPVYFTESEVKQIAYIWQEQKEIDILRNANHAKIRKIPATRNEAYCKFIRLKPCLVYQCHAPATVAHLVPKGAARNNSSDYWTVPLCMEHHHEQETRGNDWFEHEYSVDFVLAIELQIHEFFQSLTSNSQEKLDSSKKIKAISTKPKVSGFDKWISEMSDAKLKEKGNIRNDETIRRIRRGKWDKSVRVRMEEIYKYLEKYL